MISLGLWWTRLGCLFCLLFSLWPWEHETDQVKKSSLELAPQVVSLARTLKVALFYELPSVKIGVPSAFEVTEVPEERPLSRGNGLSAVAVRPDPAGIRVGSELHRVSGLRITSRTQEVEVQNRKYHSAIEILKNPKGTLTVVNEIDVEDYLKGVLPAEMKALWPEEALKAQAVISRTYAVFKNLENKDLPFALSADVESQVYAGKSIEQLSTNRAVEKTRGEILVTGGKIFPTFFHSTCGGRTTRADYLWKIEPHPSLKGVECSFCQGSKFYRWQAEFSLSEIESLLMKKGYNVSGIRSLTPEEVDVSGRPRFFSVRHANGQLKIPAQKLRLALGADRLRSAKAEIQSQGDRVVFQGMGWGHGAGLCQWGAKRLAELGYRYQDILRYYYPGSEIRNLEDWAEPGAVSLAEAAPRERNPLKRWFGGIQSYLEDL